MISIQETSNLNHSAKFTFENMAPYYAEYGVDWKLADILEKIEPLDNYDVIKEGMVVGALRIELQDEACYVRDLQVSSSLQNQGIGRLILDKALELASNESKDLLQLRVFKISPAINLYKRFGFVVKSEEERFYNMEMKISER